LPGDTGKSKTILPLCVLCASVVNLDLDGAISNSKVQYRYRAMLSVSRIRTMRVMSAYLIFFSPAK
jgi:hypothetical protein